MAEPVVLSASSLTTFLRCGRQWFFAYVRGDVAPPSLRAVRGIAVHVAAETDFRQKIDTEEDLPVGDLLDAFSDSYDTEIKDGWRTDHDEKPDDVKDKGYQLVKLFRAEVAPKIQPELVEEPIQFTINGQTWTGQIDVAQRVPVWNKANGEVDYRLQIRDTKTTGRSPMPDAYTLNMTGYAVGVRAATGEVEADTVLDYLVANKLPVYKPIARGGPITDDEVRSFSWIVGEVAANIRSGRFVPNGLINGACGWCGYRSVCPAYLKQNPNA